MDALKTNVVQDNATCNSKVIAGERWQAGRVRGDHMEINKITELHFLVQNPLKTVAKA